MYLLVNCRENDTTIKGIGNSAEKNRLTLLKPQNTGSLCGDYKGSGNKMAKTIRSR